MCRGSVIVNMYRLASSDGVFFSTLADVWFYILVSVVFGTGISACIYLIHWFVYILKSTFDGPLCTHSRSGYYMCPLEILKLKRHLVKYYSR